MQNRIKELRKQKKVSQIELAKAVHVNQSAVSQWETGRTTPDKDCLLLLADFFHVSVDYLLGKDSMQSESLDYTKYGFLPIETKKIPLLGNIACGEPIFADQGMESYVEVGAKMKADFALKAQGDSMIGARILDGDIVFVRSQPTVENGEIAVVLIEDEATLKRVFYYPEHEKLMLYAENPHFPPKTFVGAELERVKILGKAIAFQSDVV